MASAALRAVHPGSMARSHRHWGYGRAGLSDGARLVGRGATTILAGRNPDKGAKALSRIQRSNPDAKVRFEMLDLASLASVGRFAAAVSAAHGGVIDILVNNAGVMSLPTRLLTEDGFEQQIGVNYLGHFALTARLKDALCRSSGDGRDQRGKPCAPSRRPQFG
jgi:NAD(P)-dependent dehydrogenase (short-subunit alcohol dehydrogenase family)